MYDYDDYYDEPSEFERQIEEFKDGLVKAVKREHQEEIERLRNDNARLSAVENEMKEKSKQLDREIKDIECKKEHLKSEVESEFWALTIHDVLNRVVEQSLVWYAENFSYQGEKCELCNDERKQSAKFIDGTEALKDCTCAKWLYSYRPQMSQATQLTIRKKNSRYRSDKSFFLDKTFKPSKDDSNDYSYGEFKINNIVVVFCEETKKLHEDKRYGEKIAFTSEMECQKYCDWLNEKANA